MQVKIIYEVNNKDNQQVIYKIFRLTIVQRKISKKIPINKRRNNNKLNIMKEIIKSLQIRALIIKNLLTKIFNKFVIIKFKSNKRIS
jgi:hypothetical protein